MMPKQNDNTWLWITGAVVALWAIFGRQGHSAGPPDLHAIPAIIPGNALQAGAAQAQRLWRDPNNPGADQPAWSIGTPSFEGGPTWDGSDQGSGEKSSGAGAAYTVNGVSYYQPEAFAPSRQTIYSVPPIR